MLRISPQPGKVEMGFSKHALALHLIPGDGKVFISLIQVSQVVHQVEYPLVF
jgi:hypothetical protein